MDAERFFKEMYYNIWQSNDLSRIDEFYAKDFVETISVADENKNPVELMLHYDDIVKQAASHKENHHATEIEIKKLVVGEDNHITVQFHASSICNKSNELQHRCVCGIWHLNKAQQIDRVWAVVAPYYPS